MCVIIHRPGATHQLTDEILQNCWDNNSHGWGVMFAEEGQVHVRRGMDFASFKEACADLEGKDLGIHFRIRTHGDTDINNTHPFQVISSEVSGREIWMMHNGVIKTFELDKSKSDTWHYAKYELGPMLHEAPSLLTLEPFLYHVGERIGYSKLLLVDDDGKFTIVNEKKGTNLFGCWFSNGHSHNSHKRASVSESKYVSPGYYAGAQTWNKAPPPQITKIGEKKEAASPLAEGANASCEDCVLPISSSKADEAKGEDALADNSTDVSSLSYEEIEALDLTAKMQAGGKTEAEINEALEKLDQFHQSVIQSDLNWQEDDAPGRFRSPGRFCLNPEQDIEAKIDELVANGELDWPTLSSMSALEIRALVRMEPNMVADFIYDNIWQEEDAIVSK